MIELFPAIWATILVVVLVVEVIALARKERGDTLSEQVWSLMKKSWARLIIIPTWIWLTYHFFIEPAMFKSVYLTTYMDDLGLVVTTMAIVFAHMAYRSLRRDN